MMQWKLGVLILVSSVIALILQAPSCGKATRAEQELVLGHKAQERWALNEALSHYDLALQLNPRMAEAHVARGTVWVFEDKNRALVAFNKAVATDPK